VFTLTLELSEEETRTLREAAAREGTTLEEAARTAMMRGVTKATSPVREPNIEFRNGIEYRDGKRYFEVKASFRGDGRSIVDTEEERMEGFGRD
jgi:hypothetical protein